MKPKQRDDALAGLAKATAIEAVATIDAPSTTASRKA
jgi:hypothetical protein